MIFWNLDKEIKSLEERLEVYGHFDISIYRIPMGCERMRHFKLVPLAYQKPGANYHVWVVSLGTTLMPDPFYYGHTVREAWEKAKQAALSLINHGRQAKGLTTLQSILTLLNDELDVA